MTFIRETVKQEDWEFFNALNIKFLGKHISANKYSSWVIDREREIIFTRVGHRGLDYGETYILIWEQARVYIYAESRSTEFSNGAREYRWYIENIEAPLCLKDRQEEVINLIKEVADINYDRRSSAIFVIANIVEPQFIEGE